MGRRSQRSRSRTPGRRGIGWMSQGGSTINIIAPALSGSLTVDSVITTTDGTWENPPVSYSYQWYRDGVAIPGQTNNNYTVITNDVGRGIYCRVQAGSSYANSNTVIGETTLTDGLIHWWEASEGPADWANSVASAPSLVYTAGANPSTMSVFKRGYGSRITTTNNYETSAVQTSPNGTGSFTVVGWFSLDVTSSIQMLPAQWGASNRRWRIYYDKTAGQFKVNISVNGSTTATTLSVTYSEALLLKETTFYVFEHDAENDFIRLKVGNHASLGAFTSTAHSTGIFNGTGQKIGIGTDGGGNKASAWFGLTGIYNRKLTTSEHEQLWNYGRGVRYPFDGVDDVVLDDDEFVFYIIPDTQHLLAPSGTSARRTKQWGWNMADMARELGGVNMCWHVGDVRHKILATDPNVPATWTNGLNSFQFLIDKGILFGPQIGNHDLDEIGLLGPGRVLTEYHGVFPQSYLSGQAGFNGGFYDSTIDNYYHLFSAGGEDFILISLEPVPRDVVMDWAEDLVINNPTRKVIYISHQILSATTGQNGGDAIFMDSNDNTMTGTAYNNMGNRNGGTAQYNQILKPYANSFLAFCGHDNTDPCNGNLVQIGDQGNVVNLVLRNYQEEDNIDSDHQGWFVVVRVNTTQQTIKLDTFLTAQQTFNWTPVNLDISPEDQNIILGYTP